MTRVQAREFDQFLLKFDTLTIKMGDSRKKVEKVVERLNGNESEKKKKPIGKSSYLMSQDCD